MDIVEAYEQTLEGAILEAYEQTLEGAMDLGQYGIEVEITPQPSDYWPGPEAPLPEDKWVDILFRFKTKAQAKLVKERADELGSLGIVFDMSGTKGERDWQIDWSFNVLPEPDAEWKARREDVEETIEKMSIGAGCPHEW